MKCIHLNVLNVLLIILSIVVNNIQQTHMAADNHMELNTKDISQKNVTNIDLDALKPRNVDSVLHCPSDMFCNKLKPPCINCEYNLNCMYGKIINTTCRANQLIQCKGDRNFQRSLICRYCYQTEPWEHSCDLKANCNSVATPRASYRTNCTVNGNILCLGNRTFFKNVRCNWTGGYRWSTALILSITLGGFGADRFYLGHWQEGIGKLFSFGGLGVWTIVDVILISLHYLGPADGSLYI